MTRTILTLGRTTRKFELRGKAETLPTTGVGDFREVTFQCGFNEVAVNGPPEIRITVTDYTNHGSTSAIRVDLQPPDRTAVNLGGVMVAADNDLRPANRRPRLLTNDRVATALSATAFSLNTGSGPSPSGFDNHAFGVGTSVLDNPPFPNPNPPGGGGGGSVRHVVTHPLKTDVDPQGRWTVRVHNLSQQLATFFVVIDYPESVQTLETTRVPFDLLNRVFGEAMLLMSPKVRIDGGRAKLEFADEFKRLSGLSDIVESVPALLQNISLDRRLARAGCDVETGYATMTLDLQFEEIGDEIVIGTPLGDIGINVANMSMQFGFHFYLENVGSGDFFQSALRRTNGTIAPRQIGVRPFLYTSPQIVSTLLDIVHYAAYIATLSLVNPRQSITDAIEAARESMDGALGLAFHNGIGDYVRELLVNIVERNHAIHTLTCDRNHIIVEHHALPADVPLHGLHPGGANGGPQNVVAEHPAIVKVREGDIDHIVFLMMENRSFDHMLGYLGLKGKADFNGLSGTESNAIQDGNPPYVVHRLTKTHGIPTPPHDHDHTLEQIANGAMTGFAKSSSKRLSMPDPGVIMGYYTEAELPIYNFFADNFAVCDAWFSSHPGSTFANRFCTLTGKAPELENFEVDDERVGYFDGVTIFDFLSNANVDWRYVEGNVGFIRMFNKYRLDTEHVIPFADLFDLDLPDTFAKRVEEGNLPAVTFIDPRFIDVPPNSDANDDLPPADVCLGQKFVKKVYDLLSKAPTWGKTMLVVTYDEHGGFFDHAAPPGTPPNPATLARVNPNGADHLGVRVPAFVVSPWVDAGKVIKTNLEHTSIIKTILERFVSTHQANTGLSARSAQANSLFPELRPQARTDIPVTDELTCSFVPGATGPSVNDNFKTSMRLIGLPAARRARLGPEKSQD